MAESNEGMCQQCGAKLLPKWRFCVACSAPVPGAPRKAQGKLAESLRHLPSTRQPDKTIVFVPEYREERLKRQSRNRKVLIATMVSCVALAIAGFAVWRVGVRKKAETPKTIRETMARRDLDLYSKAFETFHLDFGRYPTVAEGISALSKQPPALAGWRGPYIEADYSVDPWGHDYVYQSFNDGKAYIFFTYGPEGEAAGRYYLQINSQTPGVSIAPK